MRILYLTNYFPPEVGTGPHLPYELSEWLVRAGHQVTVVTGFPRYNLPVMPEKYRHRLFFDEEMGGIRVLRINAPNFYGKTRLSRGLVQLLAPPLLGLRASWAVPRPDIVFTDTPPLLLAVAARCVAQRFRVPCVAQVMDLFPQTVIDMGLLRNRLAIRVFERMERSVYRKSSALAVLSEGYRQYVVQRGADPERTHVVPTWADTEAICPGERLNGFRRACGLQNEFVVVFAGTMGFFQGLNTLIEAARRLAGERDLAFLMVGDGVERAQLEERAAGLANVRFVPMQPKDVYPQVLAAGDLGLVMLHPSVSTPTVPSKLMTIMAAGRPIVAGLPVAAGRDAERCIAEARCGLVVPAGDPTALASAILKIKQDPEAARQMGLRGRAYAERHYSRSVCIRSMEAIFERTIAAGLARPGGPTTARRPFSRTQAMRCPAASVAPSTAAEGTECKR